MRFEQIAERAGVSFGTNNSPTPEKNQPEAIVAGVAVFDYDGDGYPDLYFVNGGQMPSLDRNGSQLRRLYHSNGNLTYTDVTAKAGLAGAGYGMGVAVGDYHNDGHPDLYFQALPAISYSPTMATAHLPMSRSALTSVAAV